MGLLLAYTVRFEATVNTPWRLMARIIARCFPSRRHKACSGRDPYACFHTYTIACAQKISTDRVMYGTYRRLYPEHKTLPHFSPTRRKCPHCHALPSSVMRTNRGQLIRPAKRPTERSRSITTRFLRSVPSGFLISSTSKLVV